MKNTILRILIGAIVLSLVSGVVVSIIGLVRGWNTATQFSDGFFWASAVMILIGFVSFVGYRQRAVDGLPVHPDAAGDTRVWAADALRGKTLMAIFGFAGLLLLGLSVLIPRLF